MGKSKITKIYIFTKVSIPYCVFIFLWFPSCRLTGVGSEFLWFNGSVKWNEETNRSASLGETK